MADVIDAETVDMRRVVREGALLAGAGRAILLQVAQPGVGRGVAEHSDFRYRQVDRLRTTLTYVYCMTFGTPEERSRISRIVTTVHRGVRGPGYSALDPELQLWVAATLYDTAVMLYEQWFGVFDETTADAVYQQYRVLGTGLQVTPEMWPASRAAFREYWDHMIATIEVGDRSRQVCQDLLYPRKLPLWLRPGMPVNRLVTTGLLPPRIREGYGLTWNSARQRRLDLFMGTVRLVYPRVPAPLRELPKTYYLRDMRRRLVSGKRR